MKIMIVDDNFINRKFLETLLCKYGDCILVESGEAALNVYEESEKIDMIFLDIMMPGMSGMEVLEKIREIEQEKNIKTATYIIIQTVLGELSHVEKAFEKGADAYMLKPIKKEELEAEMQEFLG